MLQKLSCVQQQSSVAAHYWNLSGCFLFWGGVWKYSEWYNIWHTVVFCPAVQPVTKPGCPEPLVVELFTFIPRRLGKHQNLHVECAQANFQGIHAVRPEALMKVSESCLSRVWRFVAPRTIQSMEFSRPEYWSGLPFPSPGDLPNPGIKPRSPTLQAYEVV